MDFDQASIHAGYRQVLLQCWAGCVDRTWRGELQNCDAKTGCGAADRRREGVETVVHFAVPLIGWSNALRGFGEYE